MLQNQRDRSITSQQSVIREEGLVLNLSRYLSNSPSSKPLSRLIIFRSTAISWKEPCHSSAHSPRFPANSKITPKDTGKKMMILVYSITGISPATTRMRYSTPKDTKAVRLLRRVQNLVERKRSIRTQQFRTRPIVIIQDRGKGTLEVPKAEQMQPLQSSFRRAGSCRKRGTSFCCRACSKFQKCSKMANCLKMKKNQSKMRQGTAVRSFLITMNLIAVPETNTAIKLLTGQASGRIHTQTTPRQRLINTDTVTIAAILLNQMSKRSIRQMVEQIKAKDKTTQKVMRRELSRWASRQTMTKRKAAQRRANTALKGKGLNRRYLMLRVSSISSRNTRTCVTAIAFCGRLMMYWYSPSVCSFILLTKQTTRSSPVPSMPSQCSSKTV